jgi:hypothetical protein
MCRLDTLKILFVCSCLEPGLDGVGDYTRRLAVELVALGHSCTLLALADGLVQEATGSEIATKRGLIPCLRLPAKQSWPTRVRQAKAFCESLEPDWISWQFVPYGFDKRGLSFGLGSHLKKIAGKRKSQIMFHEIWIGEAMQTPLKQKTVGKLQRFIIRDLLKKLHPKVVHTHTPLYQHLLGKLRAKAKILPLFGNIPLAEHPRANWLKEKWPEGWGKFSKAERASWWIFVIFGSIHPEWDSEDFWQRASAAAQWSGKKCLFISIGRPGAAGDRILRQLAKHEGELWHFLHLGPQSEEDISQCLLMGDFGVSAVPPEYIFKSGTAAAMLEHGLPVLVLRPVSRYVNCPKEVLTVGLKNVALEFVVDDLHRTKPESLLPTVARQFIDDLTKA